MDDSGQVRSSPANRSVVTATLKSIRRVWREPVENYSPPERFAAEIEVLRRVPMAFRPSAGLRAA